MSHSLNFGGPGSGGHIMSFTIINYTAGGNGEVFTTQEIGAANGSQGVICALCPPALNSLGVMLFPELVPINSTSGGFKMMQLVSGALVEIPTTTALNATITALVFFD